MKEAVILSTARTPIAKAFRGVFNATVSRSMAAFAIRAAVERASIEAGEIEDLVMGTPMLAGTAGWNLGRMSALAAGEVLACRDRLGIHNDKLSVNGGAVAIGTPMA
jgi:acetyl-CoA C-acetyltransferase